MITALIIDDEQHCIQRLERLLNEKLAGIVYLAGAATSVEEGITAIRQHAPDLVFLDIQLGRQSGFDLLEKLNKKDFDIIFTTAYDQYAVRAFRFSALDYLLKPIDSNELIQAVAKLSIKKDKNETLDKLDSLLHNIKSVHGATKRICVPVVNGIVFLQVSDIIRCKSDINYTTIFLKDRPTLVVAKTLKEFEEMLDEYNFFRVHNSHLVNMAYIKSYNKGKGGFVTMMDNSTIEVSTRRKDQFLKRLAEL